MQLVLRCYTARYFASQFRKKFSRFSRDFSTVFLFAEENVFYKKKRNKDTLKKKHYINYSKKNI